MQTKHTTINYISPGLVGSHVLSYYNILLPPVLEYGQVSNIHASGFMCITVHLKDHGITRL